MCGISGRFNLDGRPVEAAEMVAMRDVMTHRGPDDRGLFIDKSVGLAHRRLSIIDLAAGHQPMSNEDGTVTIVFNGEIYNFQDIQPALRARGHTLATRSDTEVIVHLYEDAGPDCVQRLRGMFAFALWDSVRRRLVLARDRLGVKPLYYVQVGRSLLFASEIKALLASPDVRAEIDPRALRRYLAYRHAYGEATLFKGIRQLAPAHYLVATPEGVTIRRYWDVPQQGGVSDASDAFLPLLEEAVRLRMISDVPLGCFLSGGVDSSAITGLMARHTERVQTFSIGFVPMEENELPWARMVAGRFGAEHHEFIQQPDDFFALLRRLVWHHDEPLTFPASIPLYLLSRESKAVATVMLAGEGADEILAGYGSNVRAYWLARAAARVPLALRRMLAHGPLPARMRAAAARTLLDDAGLTVGTFRLSGHEEMCSACRIALPDGVDDDADLLDEVGFGSRDASFLDRLLYFQLKTYLVALLMKQDKMSMAASIETRVPFLDHVLVELAFSLPDASKVRGRQGKYLLKQASADLLPKAVIHRTKRGFPVPIARWFRAPGNPFIEILRERQTLRDGLLDGDFVRARIDRFLSGEEISLELWAMINLELWRREFIVPGSRSIGTNHGTQLSMNARAA
jgi:asparagine synthase (glutamine-hydrolysing)